MKHAQRIPGSPRASSKAFGYARGLTLAVAVLATAALAACSGRWFDLRPQGNAPAPSSTASQNDLKSSTVTYIQGLCALPREQRDPQVRELNEALLPNHATISCGRGGGDGRPGE